LYPDRTDIQTVGFILAMLSLIIFVSEGLALFVDTPSVQLSRWIEMQVIRYDEWKWVDILYSIPSWPLAILGFFYCNAKTVSST
jgi:hypothetical protein